MVYKKGRNIHPNFRRLLVGHRQKKRRGTPLSRCLYREEDPDEEGSVLLQTKKSSIYTYVSQVFTWTTNRFLNSTGNPRSSTAYIPEEKTFLSNVETSSPGP